MSLEEKNLSIVAYNSALLTNEFKKGHVFDLLIIGSLIYCEGPGGLC